MREGDGEKWWFLDMVNFIDVGEEGWGGGSHVEVRTMISHRDTTHGPVTTKHWY